ILNIGSGLAIDRDSKFRGQGLIMELQIPVGKQIRFDESVMDAYNRDVVRRYDRSRNRGWGQNRFESDWDADDWFSWNAGKDCTGEPERAHHRGGTQSFHANRNLI